MGWNLHTETLHRAAEHKQCGTRRGVELSVPHDVVAVLEQRYGATWNVPRYMDKGTDTVEQGKMYARIFKSLSLLGIRL